MRLRTLAVVLAFAVCAGACDGSGSSGPSGSPPPTPEPGCQVLYAPPEGFLPTHTVRLPEDMGGGVRESYVDDRGDTLHLTSGIEGEFGEGGSPAGSIEVSTGEVASLIGRDRSWILRWELPGPCRTQTVGANGFTRRPFLRLARRMGACSGGCRMRR